MSRSRALLAFLLLAFGLYWAMAAPLQHTQIHGRQIPYGLRSTMLIRMLADVPADPSRDGTTSAERLLDSLGLEAGSPASASLIEAALAFDATKPPFGPGLFAKLKERASIEAQRARHLEEHRLAGEAFGKWLRSLEIESSEVDSLLSKLLDNPSVGMAIGTTDPELDRDYIAAKARAFEQGLKESLGYLPALMRDPTPLTIPPRQGGKS